MAGAPFEDGEMMTEGTWAEDEEVDVAPVTAMAGVGVGRRKKKREDRRIGEFHWPVSVCLLILEDALATLVLLLFVNESPFVS